MTFLPGWGSFPPNPPPINLNFQSSASDTDSTTTWTFNSVPLGTPESNRFVVVCAAIAHGDTNGLFFTSMTLNGQAMTELVDQDHVGLSDNGAACAIYIIAESLLSSADIVITTQGCTRCYIQVHTLTNLASATPVDTAATITNGGSLAVDIPEGGAVIACAANYDAATYTWSGIDEKADSNAEGLGSLSSASRKATAAESSAAISATGSSNVAPAYCACAASFAHKKTI